ncbi:hypothetical protein QBC35DRAFT_16652 [Podospora australis]|uniref:MARVEL domain-containing protein n=1 Tax=Podospora australis TaxID=1536484 RepID=A0AAN6WNJ6_9PEZI|nr:hypothetical protein QBC35DRAFT_16652 [Podospora australis]
MKSSPPEQPHDDGLGTEQDYVVYDSDIEAGRQHDHHPQGQRHQRSSSNGTTNSKPKSQPRQKPWYTPRSILAIFSIMISLALLGMGIKVLVKYDAAPLIHVSVAFVIFTAVASITWSILEFIAICARRQQRGIYPGAHVGVHMCLCLACIAAMSYASIWVSHYNYGRHREQQPDFVEGPLDEPLDAPRYHPLFKMGIVIVVLVALSLVVHFILSILACQEIRKKEDKHPVRTLVTIRYDGVGPTGTARPTTYYQGRDDGINLPVYSARDPDGNVVNSQPGPIVIARGDLGVEVRPDGLREPEYEDEEEYVAKPPLAVYREKGGRDLPSRSRSPREKGGR